MAPRPHPTGLRGAMKKRVVRAEEFEVVDEQGNVRLRIGISNDDMPFFSMLSPDGQVRARFGLGADGSAGLAIGDDNGKVRATLGLSSDGSASLRNEALRNTIRALSNPQAAFQMSPIRSSRYDFLLQPDAPRWPHPTKILSEM